MIQSLCLLCLTVSLTMGNPERLPAEAQPLAVLEDFLAHLSSAHFDAAYKLVSPTSKKNGDPIAYQAPLDHEAFTKELARHIQEDRDIRDETLMKRTLPKFARYQLGKHRWESSSRFRVWLSFSDGDNDEVLILRENGKWYIGDPIHIIR